MPETGFYCVKCRAKVNGAGGVTEHTVSGKHGARRLLKSTCPNCGTKVNKFIGGGSTPRKPE